MGCDLFFYLIKFNMSIGIKSYANATCLFLVFHTPLKFFSDENMNQERASLLKFVS